MQHLSTDLCHMGLHKKNYSGTNQSHTTSLRQNLVPREDCRLPWGGQGGTGRLSHARKGKCWLKQRQVSSHACARCRSPAAWHWLCPGKSVPGSAKGSQFKLKDFEQWLSTGESLMGDSEREQPRAGRRAWGGPGRQSNVWEPWWGDGSNKSELVSSGQGILNSSSMLSSEPRGMFWEGIHIEDVAVMWKETSFQSSQDRKQGKKNAKNVQCYFKFYVWPFWGKSLCFPLSSLKDPSLTHTSTAVKKVIW